MNLRLASIAIFLGLTLLSPVRWVIAAWFIARGNNRAWRFLVAEDQGWNVLLLNGEAKSTISRHAALACQNGDQWGCDLCKVLSEFDPDHCKKALES